MYTCLYICIYIYIYRDRYIYIYIERERETYIYIYIHTRRTRACRVATIRSSAGARGGLRETSCASRYDADHKCA